MYDHPLLDPPAESFCEIAPLLTRKAASAKPCPPTVARPIPSKATTLRATPQKVPKVVREARSSAPEIGAVSPILYFLAAIGAVTLTILLSMALSHAATTGPSLPIDATSGAR